MTPVRVVVETSDANVEYVAHVVNRSRYALRGALRSAWKRYPRAKAVSAEFTEHACNMCSSTHTIEPIRRVYNRVPARRP